MDTSDREPQPMENTVQPEAGPIRSYGWEWGREEDRRPKLPWIGIFLMVYGVLLLVDRLGPQYLTASNLLVLAAGLAFLIVWLLRRGTFPLYAGAFLTASAIPGLVKSLGYDLGTGFGTLCYGIALLFIGLVRFTRGGGIGWQALIGVLLIALGGSELALPDAASLVLPILVVVFGLVLLTRDRRPGNWRG
jgi:hypothetical protein